MKSVKWLLLTLFYLSITVSGLAKEEHHQNDPGAGNHTVHIATGEYIPGYSAYIRDHGYVLHVVKEAFALVDIQVEYHFFPWKRGHYMAEKGKYDAACCWFHTDERAKHFYISEAVENTGYYFFHLKSFEFDWNRLDDLKGLHIGATLEYTYTKEFWEGGKTGKLKIHPVPKDEQNLKKLLKGRIHIFPLGLINGFEMIRNIFPPEKAALFTYHPKPLTIQPTNLLFSKKIDRNKDISVLFDKGLKLLKESGRYGKIIKDAEMGKYKKMKNKWKPLKKK